MKKIIERGLELLLARAAVVPVILVVLLIAIWWKGCDWEPECMVQWTDKVLEDVTEYDSKPGVTVSEGAAHTAR